MRRGAEQGSYSKGLLSVKGVGLQGGDERAEWQGGEVIKGERQRKSKVRGQGNRGNITVIRR